MVSLAHALGYTEKKGQSASLVKMQIGNKSFRIIVDLFESVVKEWLFGPAVVGDASLVQGKDVDDVAYHGQACLEHVKLVVHCQPMHYSPGPAPPPEARLRQQLFVFVPHPLRDSAVVSVVAFLANAPTCK